MRERTRGRPGREAGTRRSRPRTGGWASITLEAVERLGVIEAGRRRRRRRGRVRLAAFALLVAVGVAVAAVALIGGTPARELAAERFASEWAHGEDTAAYAQLRPGSVNQGEFMAALRAAASTATLSGASVSGPAVSAGAGVYRVPVRERTRAFGTLAQRLVIATTPAGAIVWSPALAFGGLSGSETLSRIAVAPRRGVLLTRDGTPLDALASAANVIGTVGQPSGVLAERVAAEGFPPSTPVGLDGLELLFQRQLGGVPGGELFAGRRLLARTAPIAGIDVRTSISPTLQTLAVGELGASIGGIVAMEPGNGELLAAAGAPLSELQPPGSTFKIITLTAVLEAHIANAATVFPYATSATIDSYVLHNSDDEDCGGTLANAFAVSCNSVFAPLGVRVGASRLTAAAEAYGFNAPSPVAIAAQSTLPAGASIGGDIAVGSTAIGQAQVLASPLQMLRVAGTIALVGRLPAPTFALVARRRFPRVVPVAVARTIRSLMRDVVVYGTGTAAQIPGVAVAGKTGTAQVATPSCGPTGASGPTGSSGATATTGASAATGSTGAGGTTAGEGTTSAGAATGATGASTSNGTGGASAGAVAHAASGATGATGCPTIDNNPHDTDAWFVAFAPEIHPRIVVAVLLPNDGVGGTTAAPLARAILAEGLALTR